MSLGVEQKYASKAANMHKDLGSSKAKSEASVLDLFLHLYSTATTASTPLMQDAAPPPAIQSFSIVVR